MARLLWDLAGQQQLGPEAIRHPRLTPPLDWSPFGPGLFASWPLTNCSVSSDPLCAHWNSRAALRVLGAYLGGAGGPEGLDEPVHPLQDGRRTQGGQAGQHDEGEHLARRKETGLGDVESSCAPTLTGEISQQLKGRAPHPGRPLQHGDPWGLCSCPENPALMHSCVSVCS